MFSREGRGVSMRRLGRLALSLPSYARDQLKSTFGSECSELASGLFCIRDGEKVESPALSVCCGQYLQHRFDILGSGWVAAGSDAVPMGFEGMLYGTESRGGDPMTHVPSVNRANRATARRLLQLVSVDFAPIDWSRDIRSGYRWPESIWSGHIQVGNVPGADVKTPWELGRCQHLVQVAVHAVAGDASPELAKTCAREYQDTVLQFIASNPPRFGVQWMTGMDAGVRVANWLVARDVLVSAGLSLSADFDRVLARSVVDHAHLLVEDLHSMKVYKHNHHLCALAGLAFCAVYLQTIPERKQWIEYVLDEVLQEAGHQFNEDGGSFEGSTAYHALSADALLWTTVLLKNLLVVDSLEPNAALDDHTMARVGECIDGVEDVLRRAAEFSAALTRPDGTVVQVGDNDSGRFMKPTPQVRLWDALRYQDVYVNRLPADWPPEVPYPVEEPMDHSMLARRIQVVRSVPRGQLVGLDELCLPNALSGTAEPSVVRGDVCAQGAVAARRRESVEGRRYVRKYRFSAISEFGQIQLRRFSDFGIYVFRGEGLFATVRCGPVGLEGRAGHSHCDQLSLELWLDGNPVVVDPGCYTYTASPRRRNEYRSTSAHWSPKILASECAPIARYPFAVPGMADGVCTHSDAFGFVGYCDVAECRLWRAVEFLRDSVVITDGCDEAELVDLADHEPLPYSPGYGLRLRSSQPTQPISLSSTGSTGGSGARLLGSCSDSSIAAEGSAEVSVP